MKYPFNYFSYGTVFSVSSSQKTTNILFYAPTTKLYKYVYKIMYTSLKKIHNFAEEKKKKGIPVAEHIS